MESLRERQRREVLDEDKVINQRVFDIITNFYFLYVNGKKK